MLVLYMYYVNNKMFFIFYIFSKNKLNKKIKILEKNNKNNFEKINNEKIKL